MAHLRLAINRPLLLAAFLTTALGAQDSRPVLMPRAELSRTPTQLRLTAISSAIGVLPNGRLVVGEADADRVSIVDSTGRVTAQVATGIASGIAKIGVVGDNIWLQGGGMGSAQILVISASGKTLRTIQLSATFPTGDIAPYETRALATRAILPDDRALAYSPAKEVGSPYRFGLGLAAYVTGPWGKAPDRLVATHPPRCFAPNRPGQQPDILGIPHCEIPRSAISIDAQYVAIAVPVQTASPAVGVQVTLIRITGDTVYSAMVPVTGRPLTDASRDSIRLRLTDSIAGTVVLPQVYPMLREVFVGADGRVLLRIVEATEEWLVLSPTGRVEGVIRWPSSSADRVFRGILGDRIWVAEGPVGPSRQVVRYQLLDAASTGQ